MSEALRERDIHNILILFNLPLDLKEPLRKWVSFRGDFFTFRVYICLKGPGPIQVFFLVATTVVPTVVAAVIAIVTTIVAVATVISIVTIVVVPTAVAAVIAIVTIIDVRVILGEGEKPKAPPGCIILKGELFSLLGQM